MNWPGPILTDSGGFQVFSLAKIRKIRAHGVEFRSHLDGSPLFLGPKEAMEIQRLLGSDIAMVFDECPPHDCPPKAAQEAVERTLAWARECRAAAARPRPGGLRHRAGRDQPAPCANDAPANWSAMDFDGYAIGGVSVGEPEHEMMKAVEMTEPFLPAAPAALRHGPGHAGAIGGIGGARGGYV